MMPLHDAVGRDAQSLNIFVFNVRGCSTNKAKKGEIGEMLLFIIIKGARIMCLL